MVLVPNDQKKGIADAIKGLQHALGRQGGGDSIEDALLKARDSIQKFTLLK